MSVVEPEAQWELEEHYAIWWGDYQRTKKLLYVLVAIIFMAGIVFLLTSNKLYAGGIIVLSLGILGLVHTPFALFILYAMLAVESGFMFSQIFSISKAMGIIVLLSFLFTRMKKGLVMPAVVKLILVLAGYALVSLLWALSPIYGAFGVLTLFLNVGLLIITVSTIRDKDNFKMVMWALVIGAIVASLMSFVVQIEFEGQAAEEIGRVSLSEGGGVSNLANSVLLGFLAGLYLFLEGSKLTKLFISVVSVLMLYVILRTQTRISIGTAFVAPVLAFLVCARGPSRWRYYVGVLFLLLLAFVAYYIMLRSPLLSERAKERIRGTKYDLGESGRTDIWRESLRYIEQNPMLGFGWFNYPVRRGFTGGLGLSHNNVLDLTCEVGVIGLAICTIIYILLFRGMLKVPDPHLRWVGLAVLFFNLMSGITMTTYHFKYFWYSITFAIVAANIGKDQEYGKSLEPME